MKHCVSITAAALVLTGCGGGSGTESPAPNANANAIIAATPTLSAKPLADNKVRLTLSGVDAQASRFCIVQDNSEPAAGAACFTTDADAALLVQEKAIANPSDSTRATFTAWVKSSAGVVSRHASVSAPGKTCSAGAYAAIGASTLPAVCIITSSGESVVLLESVKAPISAANFLRYVNQGFYDQTVFHRFWKGSLNFVQGGGYNYNAAGYDPKASTLPPIVLESPASTGLLNTAGTIAMARTPEPDSATAGFFVNTQDNPGFDSASTRSGYAVFGRFVHGANSWSSLLDLAVPGSGEVTEPGTAHWLRWAYQIQ